jgi:hypothetical protein
MTKSRESGGKWVAIATEAATDWLESLDQAEFLQIGAAIDALEEEGPTLGEPFVKRISKSRHHNMKELRSSGGNLRMLFAFDPERRALLLLGGDKTGEWNRWYDKNIPIADDLYDAHLKELEKR